MFDSLSDKLQRVFKNLRGEGKLTAENMEAALKEIRVALLEADVHFKVVKQFMEAVKVKALFVAGLESVAGGDGYGAGMLDADMVEVIPRNARRAAAGPDTARPDMVNVAIAYLAVYQLP